MVERYSRGISREGERWAEVERGRVSEVSRTQATTLLLPKGHECVRACACVCAVVCTFVCMLQCVFVCQCVCVFDVSSLLAVCRAVKGCH